ncbi:hypothetical protein CRUP_006103 [Coryphaenoides rupestris]|nr:hypothetical protein CRUP_006103 [Coryphaenoides rupestris]
MSLVPKRCNDMMNLGRLQGYEGKLSSQGKLLEQETFGVLEHDGGVLSRSKERRIFLFEHIIIFKERFTLQAPSPSIKSSWVEQITQLLDTQRDFLSEYQRKEGMVSRPLSSGRPSSVPLTPNGHANQDTETHEDQDLVLVLQDFSAVREDEITVVRGDRVQVLSSNQQGQSLVFRPANSESPPAEGWVPRSVLNIHT